MQVFTPADLVPLFEEEGLLAQAPPDWFDAERSLAFSAGIVGRGLVKFCAPVADKMATQTIGAALEFRAGDAVEMALRTACIQAIGLKYDQRLTEPAEVSGLSARGYLWRTSASRCFSGDSGAPHHFEPALKIRE